jgi:phosphoglycolate phosphatase
MRLFSHAAHVVWDWNGTLLDDREHCVSVLNGMLRDAKLPAVDSDGYRRLFDFPVQRYYEKLGFDLTPEGWEELAVRFIRDYDAGSHGCSLHARAMDVVQRLRETGRESSILSAARRTSLENELERRGIRRLFRDVNGLDDHYARGKRELGLRWIEGAGHPPAEVVLIGDTVHDFEVATAMGASCVLVAAGHHARDRLERCGCPVVDDLEQLLG